MNKYRFSKSYFDIAQPTVLKGCDIKNGATVEIIRRGTKPGKDNWVHIEDENGNVVATDMMSLIPIKEK